MSEDAEPKKRSLSEISHLFLSSVRERQQSDGPVRPQRTPPPASRAQARDLSVDLTPEEFAQMYGGGGAAGAASGGDSTGAAPEVQRKAVPVTAVIGGHLNGRQFDRVKEYARHLAANIGRVGLVELDASELRLMCFDPSAPHGPDSPEAAALECAEPRQIAEALEELNWDVEEWLLLLPNPRTPEARALLREVDHWVLLSTCDHDGVVSSYRMLKALSETRHPRLSLALLDAADEETATRVFQKLIGVCQQFLDWPADPEDAVRAAPGVNEHLVMLYRTTRDKAQMATASQWGVVAEFLAAQRDAADTAAAAAQASAGAISERADAESVRDGEATHGDERLDEERRVLADVVIPAAPSSNAARPPIPTTPAPEPTPAFERPLSIAAPASSDGFDDVIDLPGPDISGDAILAAVLRRAGAELIACPIRPPMTVSARLAVGRDRGLVLLAAASQGLGELRAVGQAYRWLTENRELIAMALTQFAIDARRAPRVRLLVDRADLSADALAPMLEAGHVTVQAYRKLRWGERLGVYLEAA